MATTHSLRHSVQTTFLFVAFLWLLHLLQFFVDFDLRSLGVLPRTQSGLVGILFAPLIHGSWQHLIANTPPMLLLGSMLMYGYPKSRYGAVIGIWLLSGIGVWMLARGNYHFGASGLTHGIFFYLFVSGILRRDRRSAAILMIAFYMYGGMLLTIFPRDPAISFESHLFGGASGVLFAFLLRHYDPKPERKRYPWERKHGEEDVEEEDDPIIGDQWRGEAAQGLPEEKD